jgi:hypothetical protein
MTFSSLLSKQTYFYTHSHIPSITGDGLHLKLEDTPRRREKRPTTFKKEAQQTLKRNDMTASRKKMNEHCSFALI